MSETAPVLPPDTRCWIVTNGMAGFEVQALGIAEALGVTPEMKRVSPRAPYRWIAPHGPAAPDPAIAPPWPDLLIAAGRQAIPYAISIRKQSRGATFVAVLQDPKRPSRLFDFVWAPIHDRIEGENVLKTVTSPHRLTEERLRQEAATFSADVTGLPRPYITVLIGGANAVYDFTVEDARKLGADLAAAAGEAGGALLVVASRRTSPEALAAIESEIADVPHIVWTGGAPNPYFGYLGLADTLVVTCDSVNMVGEACFTGKPVHVAELKGGSPKFRRFLDAVYASGAARQFGRRLESWTYTPLNATHTVAAEIARRYREQRTS